MGPPEERGRGKESRPPRTTKIKSHQMRPDEAHGATASASASSRATALQLNKLDTRVSLLANDATANRNGSGSTGWWWPTRLFGASRNLGSTATTLISEKPTISSSSKTNERKDNQPQATREQANNSKPMISIHVSGPPTSSARQREDPDELGPQNGGETGESEPSCSDSLVCSVENVRHNFGNLINFNKYLYFYLATLIYSVINLGLILYHLNHNHQRRSIVKNENNIQQDDDEKASNASSSKLDDPSCARQSIIAHEEHLFMVVRWFLVPAICTLLVSLVLITVRFNSKHGNRTRLGRIIYRNGQTIGQIVALLLLNLPFVLFLVHQFSLANFEHRTNQLRQNTPDPSANGTSEMTNVPNDCDHGGQPQAATSHNESQLPLGALLASLYLQPFFFQSRGLILNAKVLCLLEIAAQTLSIFWFASRKDKIDDAGPNHAIMHGQASPLDETHAHPERHLEPPLSTVDRWRWIMLAGLSLATVLVFGALKKYRFRRAICRDTFLGAGDLIEAKVSLEHQRQQQETLLLSVLPAYVAEQVKRNMLKRTNNGHEQQQPSPLALADHCNLVPHSPTQRFAASQVSQVSNGAGQQQQPSSWSSPMTHSSSTGVIRQPPKVSRDKSTPNPQRPGPASKQTTLMKLDSSNSLQTQTQTQTQRQQHNHPHRGQTKRNSQTATRSPTQLATQTGLISPSGGGGGGPTTIPASPGAGQQPLGGVRRGFNELYIRTYNNVSLLYGDIVGFTWLCTQLSSSQLVRVLNDLFSHFDHLAERHKIMRIKILGDCYYGVSGIPEFAVMGAKSRALKSENHAINCVNMGLDMISYIKCLNVERSSSLRTGEPLSHSASGQVLAGSAQVNCSPRKRRKSSSCSISGSKSAENCATGQPMLTQQQQQQQHHEAGDIQSPLPVFELNMRIGVHSGHIHSGVIGLKKWQFDVWSNDVSIAMHCESSGTAGRVQVTEATVQQLNGAFSYEEARASERDSFLATKGIRTYLIRDRLERNRQQQSARLQRPGCLNNEEDRQPSEGQLSDRAQRPNRRQQQQQHQRLLKDSMERAEKDVMLDEDKIRAATIGTIRQTLLAGESSNASGCNSIGLALDHNDLRPMSLDFRDPIIGKLYNNRPLHSSTHESAALLLLLLVALPFIDYQLLLLAHHRRHHHHHHHQPDQRGSVEPLQEGDSSLSMLVALLGSSAIGVALLLIGILWAVVRGQSSKITIGRRHHSRSTSASARGRRRRLSLADESISQSDHPIGSHSGQESRKLNHLRGAIRRCCRWISWGDQSNLMGAQAGTRASKFRSFTIVAIFFVVIALQNYLIFREKYCPIWATADGNRLASPPGEPANQVSEPIRRSMISVEIHHLAVIFALICLDASVDSLGYGSKSIIVVVVICMNVLFTFKSSPLPEFVVNFIIRHQCERDYLMQFVMLKRADQGELDDVQALIDWSTSALICLVALLSLAHARQLEYTNRANFLWRNRLGVDHEELEYISGINKVLLENILPSHVVEHYLSQPNHSTSNKVASLQNYMRMSFSNMRNSANELYHEQHESVAVMFASIPHFYEFYDESDISKQGLGCIALLNEIICDFDKLLLKNKFSRIEKIKTIGSTYMAAAGLRPTYGAGRNSTVSAQTLNLVGQNPGLSAASESNTLSINSAITQSTIETDQTQQQQPPVEAAGRKAAMSQQKLNLICMIQFATSLMSALNGINKQSFQGFKLRVGVNSGSVIAGIIGAQRPFYDIWGDCVNIASRMDSLGEIGRIQVEEKTAKLLLESLCTDTYTIVRRGPIEVKGKGGMVTYFVDKKEPSRHQQAHHHRQPRRSATIVATAAGSSPVGDCLAACETSTLSISGDRADLSCLSSARSVSPEPEPAEVHNYDVDAGVGSDAGGRDNREATNGSRSVVVAKDKQVAPISGAGSGAPDEQRLGASAAGRAAWRSNSLGFTC